MDLDISGSLDKSKISGNCGFPLTNPQNGSSLDFVPNVASWFILLKTLDFWGGIWEIHIFINYKGLRDKLHWCNKSRHIIVIVGFHLFWSLHVSFWSVMPNLSPFFFRLITDFFLRLREHVNHLCFLLVAFSVKLSERSRIDFTSFSVRI